MPGDTLQIGTKARKANHFDAIVVGSGISGGWAAKELCEQGLNVLMLERGRNIVHPDYPTATLDPWDFPHRLHLTQEEKKEKYIQARHYSFREDNKHFYINDTENPYKEIRRFDWIRGDTVGGRSLLWGRQCYRWSDLDFEANARDGVGVDWPIRYKDIAPWYDHVESFIGVSGMKEGLSQPPDGKFQPPMEMNCVEKYFKSKLEKAMPDRRLIHGRTANLTEPVKGRGTCQYRDLCHRGCPYGAYFSTNASTLPAAFATGRLTLRPESLVNRVLYDPVRGRATGVELIDSATHRVEEFYSELIFLNAATLATAFILLNSVSDRFPNGMGNGSDQVGRNLMDHHKSPSVSGTIAGLQDEYFYGRKPNGIYIPRFRNVHEKRSDYIRGFGCEGGGSRRGWESSTHHAGIGASLKEIVSEPGDWAVSFTMFGECLPYPDNRVVLNTAQKDHWGRNTVSVDAAFGENEKTMQLDMVGSMREMLDASGFTNIDVSGKMSFPGNANHEMGTARMGKDPGTSVLNAFNQLHEVKNVFVTDGSFMASSSCVNPSLTYMAMTARAAHHAVAELKKGNI
jgi:choline dehydrogenase-like flavoprotein